MNQSVYCFRSILTEIEIAVNLSKKRISTLMKKFLKLFHVFGTFQRIAENLLKLQQYTEKSLKSNRNFSKIF